MSAARADVLARIRSALTAPADRAPPAEAPRAAPPGDAVGRFCSRVEEYRAHVHRVAEAELGATLARIAAEGDLRRIAVAPGLEVTLAGAERDDAAADPRALERADAALTGCALAIAETGTIVLDGSPVCGRRALTLLPDCHVCLVRAGQVVPDMPDATAVLAAAARAGRPLTLVSGPSATSDIELERVEGVHGPRTLHVVVY